jgi:type IV pilus assembly protein PilB
MKRKKLGEVLIDHGRISPAALQKLFKEQEGNVVRLGELILERGVVDKPSLVKALEEVSRVPYLDCSAIQCDQAALQAVPRAMAVRLGALPVEMDQSRMIAAMVEPQNVATIDELRFTVGKNIVPRFGFRAEILSAIVRNYDRLEGLGASKPGGSGETLATVDGSPVEFISTSSRQANQEAIREIQAELNQRRTPAVRVVSEIILKAMSKLASDIHIEPQDSRTVVRIRVDGVLRELEQVPRSLQNQLVSRIKILSDMDIAERRAPQDGRFMVAVGQRRVDMRVSTLPTQYGEKVVMRLVEATAPISSFNDLGFPPAIADRMRQLIALPQGMLLVTGPTGSGKTTTLYSALNLLRKPAVNIVTIEDPVEYALAGVNQVHVNARAGLTFASCLRSILRQDDPNVIMIGEIRDLETAEIAMKAAQTGHMVLSTLHTNDSIAAVARLLDLGVPEYLIASSVSGILAQRLVRKLCSCHVQHTVSTEERDRLMVLGWATPPESIPWSKGCDACDNTGYKGRVGIYELLTIDDSVRSILRSGYKPDLMRAAARGSGMRRMQEDAIDKLQASVTTLEEITRVIPMEAAEAAGCESCGHQLAPAYRFCPFCGTPRGSSGPGASSEPTLRFAEGVFC